MKVDVSYNTFSKRLYNRLYNRNTNNVFHHVSDVQTICFVEYAIIIHHVKSWIKTFRNQTGLCFIFKLKITLFYLLSSAVICCNSLYQSMSFVVTCCTTRCNSMYQLFSHVVTLCTTRLSFYKRSFQKERFLINLLKFSPLRESME